MHQRIIRECIKEETEKQTLISSVESVSWELPADNYGHRDYSESKLFTTFIFILFAVVILQVRNMLIRVIEKKNYLHVLFTLRPETVCYSFYLYHLVSIY